MRKYNRKNKAINKTILEISTDNLNPHELKELKTKTEIEKLRTEIKDNEQSWLLKNLGILIASFIGLVTLGTGWYTGYFDAQRLNLENQRDSLSLKTHLLDSNYKKLKSDSVLLDSNYKKLKSDSVALYNNIKTLASIAGQFNLNTYYSSKIDRINKTIKASNEATFLIRQIDSIISQKVPIRNILWVNDKPSEISYLEIFLEKLGNNVYPALSTEEAIEKLKNGNLNITYIISDMTRFEKGSAKNDAGKQLYDALQVDHLMKPLIIYSNDDSTSQAFLYLHKKGISRTKDFDKVLSFIYNSQ